MESFEHYVYKTEVNWSLLVEGITLPVENQVIFARNLGRFLHRGESKPINIYLNGMHFTAQIRNVNFNERFKRIKDTLQIRYPYNGDLARALQANFLKSYNFIRNQREIRVKEDRRMIKLPDDFKEYLAIYTTEYDDSYIFETISAHDMVHLRKVVAEQSERVFETNFNYNIVDEGASVLEAEQIIKIRKLNRKIGDNLKLLYDNRCQICGKLIGGEYGAHVIEAHHIDYFVNSLNNDAENQLIVCPNHHGIIHEVNPVFDRKKLIYIYPNGIQEGLSLNLHL